MNKRHTNILIVVNVFRPDLGGGVLFSDLCDGLSERGFNVHVKCAYSYYPQWRDVSGQNGFRIRTQIENGYVVERHGLFIPSNPNSLFQRLLYEASFFLSLARRLPPRNKYDAILVFSPLIGSVAYAALASAWSRTPLWLNVQDLSAQAAAAGGITAGTSLLERLQNALFKRSRFWSSISSPMVEALESIPGAPSRVHLVPNWLHASLANHIASATKQGPTPPRSPLRLFYSGNIGGKQHLLAFCKSLQQCDAAFTFLIHGAGARAREVREWIQNCGDTRFEMHDLTDEKGLAHSLAEADFYVITEKPGAGSSFIPSKLIPGMSSGTPILAVCDCNGPLGLEVLGHGIGHRSAWEDLDELSDFFALIEREPHLYSKMCECALDRSIFYERERGIDRCVRVLETLTERKFSGQSDG